MVRNRIAFFLYCKTGGVFLLAGVPEDAIAKFEETTVTTSSTFV